MSQRSKSGEYASLARLAEQGDFSAMIAPLDYKILELLPDQGTLFANLYPIGASSKELSAKLKPLTPTDIGTRITVMSKMKLTVRTAGLRSSDAQYQRTQRGKEVLEKWQQQQNGSKK